MTAPTDLETRIRDKAVQALKNDLLASIDGAIARHNAQVDGSLHSAKIDYISKLTAHNSKRIGDLAVRKFLTTYDALIAEFPHLQNADDFGDVHSEEY